MSATSAMRTWTAFTDGACAKNQAKVNGRGGTKSGFGIYIQPQGAARGVRYPLRANALRKPTDRRGSKAEGHACRLWQYAQPSEPPHTNVRAEFEALIALLCLVDEEKTPVRVGDTLIVYTDLEMLMKTYNDWIERWKKTGWRKANGEPCANQDLCKRLYDIKHRQRTKVSVRWTKAHRYETQCQTDNDWLLWYGNSMADALANAGIGRQVKPPAAVPLKQTIAGKRKRITELEKELETEKAKLSKLVAEERKSK